MKRLNIVVEVISTLGKPHTVARRRIQVSVADPNDCYATVRIVKTRIKERKLWLPKKRKVKYPEAGETVFDKKREEYGHVATSGEGGFRIAFPDGSFANFYGPEGLEKFKKEYNIV